MVSDGDSSPSSSSALLSLYNTGKFYCISRIQELTRINKNSPTDLFAAGFDGSVWAWRLEFVEFLVLVLLLLAAKLVVLLCHADSSLKSFE